MRDPLVKDGLPDADPVDAYLDGLMTDAQRAEFDRRMAHDPTLRAELERQRRVDGALAEMFAGPDEKRIHEIVRASRLEPRRAATIPRSRLAIFGKVLAAAAAIGVLFVGASRILDSVRDESETPRIVAKGQADPNGAAADYNPRIALDVLYQKTVAAGFNPRWVCSDEGEFVDTFAKRLRQGLRFVPTEGLAMIGLDYANTMSEFSITFLGQAQGQNVLVTIDRASLDKGLSLPEGCNLHLFKRVIGKLVLYEITPLNEMQLLEHFEQADSKTG